MKKNVLFFFLSVCAIHLQLSAQWDSSGTQISFLHSGSSHRPFISAATQGGYYAAWQITDTSAAQLSSVWLNAFDNTGAVLPGWVSGGIKLSDTSDNYAPQLITSEDGNVIVAWCSFPHGLMTHGNIYLEKYSYAGVALWNSGIPLQLNPDSAYVNEYPVLSTDKHKGVFVVWNRYDTNIDPSSAAVILQHIDSTGNVASGWNTNPLGVAATPGVRQYYPSITITPDGQNIYVVYDTGLIGATSMLIKRLNTANGSPALNWGVNGVTISTGPNLYHLLNGDLDIFTDSSDNAIVLWIEDRFTLNGELYMQTVDTTGHFLLSYFGQRLYGDLGADDGNGPGIDYLEAVQDSDQNLLIAYDNLVNFNDVGAMRVEPNGTILWSDTLVTTGGYSAYPNLVGDGKRGMFIFYNQQQTTEKLYAIEMDSTGVMDSSWTLPGVNFGALNTYSSFDPEYDFNPHATRRGESVVAWTKGDTAGFYQIFTCNLLGNKEKCTTNTAYTDTTIPAAINTINADGVVAKVFPNPCQQNTTVNFVSNENYEHLTFSMYDVEGRLMLQTSIAKLTDNQINTALLAQGLYIYRITGDNVMLATGKLVKQ